MKLHIAFIVFVLTLASSVNFALAQEKPFTPEAIVALANSQTVPDNVTENIVCPDQTSHSIIMFKPGTNWNDASSVVWSWKASDSPEIKKEHRHWFNHPDECKPVLNATHLLLTASGGGVALVRKEDKKTLFYTRVEGNPHSAALLPDGNIASVSSSGFIRLYTVPEQFTGPNVPFIDYPLYGGHGLVWDAQAKRLWGLGYTELAVYEYNFDKANPKLTKVDSISVKGTPAAGGHDLYPIPGTRAFLLTGVGVAVFDIETKKFTTIWNNMRNKSVTMSQPPKSLSLTESGAFIILTPSNEWYTSTIRYFNKQLTPVGTKDGARFYKARWWTPNEFSDGKMPEE